MSYIGVPPFGQTVRTITELTASAGQTTFNVSGGYLPGYVDVFLNGVSLASGDFTSTNGSTVVLGAAASLNDEFKAIAYWPVSLIDTYRKSEADALLATKQAASNVLTTYASTGIGFRNRIINGDMRIDQRNAGAQISADNAVFGVDRFQMLASVSSKLNVQQNAGSVTPPAGFSNYLGFTSTSAYSVGASEIFAVNQKIEGFNTADLAWGTASAQSVTLSFWVRSSLTGTFSGMLFNSAANRSYVFSYTISAANTWEQKSVTIAGDTTGTWLTNNGIGIRVFWTLAAGSSMTGSAGSWVASDKYGVTGTTSVVGTNGATFYITGVQLEAGSVASPFERRDYGRELFMCQRYYEAGSIYNYWNTTTYSIVGMRFLVAKRATPTMTVTASQSWSGGAVGTTLASIGNDSQQFHVTNPNNGNLGALWTASAEL